MEGGEGGERGGHEGRQVEECEGGEIEGERRAMRSHARTQWNR